MVSFFSYGGETGIIFYLSTLLLLSYAFVVFRCKQLNPCNMHHLVVQSSSVRYLA